MGFKKHHWFMIVLTFVFIGFAIFYSVGNYDKLPDKIPTHFNALGEPDSWSNKSMVNLLIGSFITLPILLIMLPIVWWIAKVNDPRKIINGPREKVEKMSLEKAEQIRRIALFHILLIMLLIALLVMIVSIESVLVAMGEKTSLGFGNWIITTLLILDTFYLVWKFIKLDSK